MVTFSSLLLALTAITGSLAAPADLVKNDVIIPDLDLAKRGPSNFVIDATNSSTTLASLARRGSAINYNQDYTTGGTVDYYHSSTGFQVNWNTQNDFVVGIGWSPGSNTPINFGGQFSVYGGTGLLSVYGWSTNPLVEYYIIEDYANPPSFGTQKGTVYSDGGTYVIWENTRYNAPSIEGTSTFNQYISVRQSPRTQGIVTVQNHFNAWAQHGMNLGALNYQVVAVEGWGGSGTASYAVNNN